MITQSNENQLLIYCAQPEIQGAALDNLKGLLAQPLNWKEIIKSAFLQGTAPLLHYNLKDLPQNDVVPEGVRKELRRAYHQNLARNMYIYAELNRIVDAFHEKGIKIIVLKGAALAKLVYPDIGLRPMGDIDLLVPSEVLPAVGNIMAEIGYHFNNPKPPAWYIQNHNHLTYLHADGCLPVEIHWHIANKSDPLRIRDLDTDIITRWWQRAQGAEISGRKVLVLSSEDLVFYLCLHFMKHRFWDSGGDSRGGLNPKGAFLQLCDILQTLKLYRNEIDWILLRHEAKNCGLTGLMDTTFSIIDEFVGRHNDIFSHSFKRFGPGGGNQEVVDLMKKKLFSQEDKLPIDAGSVIRLQAAKTFRKQLKMLFNYLCPHPETIAKRYAVPSSSIKVFFYYLIHPLKILLDFGRIMRKSSRIKEEVILKKWIETKN